jgi:arylsulfatase A-like enzyme/lysophospholipase L1-like esterase
MNNMQKTLAILAALSVLGLGAQAGISINQQLDNGWNVPATTSGTSSFTGVSAQVGDVIVLTVAGNKKGTAISLSAAQVGGTGTVGSQTQLTNLQSTYPTSWAWYQTVTAAGTFNFDITTDNTAGITAITALYVIRADSGAIELADSATWDDNDNADNGTAYSLNYTFGTTLTDGVLIESISSRTDLITPPGTYTLDRTGASKRSLLSYDGVTGSAWTSAYSLSGGTANKQTSGAVGMIFSEVTGGNRAPTFNSDPVVGPAISTNGTYSATLADYATDLDSDPMTFWKTTGPGWLSVASDGALTGTAPGTTGLNSWTVFVADNNGGTNSATLEINVAISDYVEVPLTSSNLYVQGAKFVNIDGNGMNFHRFDAGIISGATAVNVNAGKAKTTSGVKLSFYTRSDTVKLYFDYIAGDENRNSRFGLYQNGARVDTPYFAKTETNIVITLTSLGAPGELVRHDVVLPNWSNPILSKMELKTGEVLEAGNPYPAKKMVVLGDSISHGTGQGASYLTYPYLAAEQMDVELFNMAVGGGKIAPEVADLLQHFGPVDAIWVLAGYNDWQGSSETITSITNDYESLLATIRLRQPDAQVFCSTLTYTTNLDDPESGVTAIEHRAGVSAVVNARITAGDTKLHLIQGDDYSDATYLNDAVHFNEPGAAMFATNVVAIMDPIVNPVVNAQNGTNVLFIAIDDINPVLGCYGDTNAITPRMDALAASGITFLNAHCQWSVCGPSRASLSTGLMPEETGVMGFRKMRGDADNSSRVNTVKRPNVVTLQQYFRYNGYRTAATGKINDYRCVGTLNTTTGKVAEDGSDVDDPPSWGDPVDPNNLPADFFSNSAYVKAASGWDPAGKPVAAAADLPDSSFTDGIACDEGIALMQNLATNDAPFFLGVGFKKPHLAFIAPQQYWDLYNRNDFSIHPFQDHPLHEVSYTWNYAKELASYDEFAIEGNSVTDIPEALQLEMIHGYYACVSFIDALVGRLLDELDAQGLADNTIVVLWGDHGFHLGDHAEWAKHTNLEKATRVPFIIRNPFSGQSNVKTDTPVGLIDIYPTLCELVGLPVPEQPLNENESPADPASGRSLKGKSLAGVVNGSASSVRTGAVNLFSRSGHNGYAYRTDRYRYTEWVNKSSNVVAARELYDYLLDPMETVNLAGEPGYDALMYQFSRSMRKEFDDMKLSGSDIAAAELQGSPIYDTTAGNMTLPGVGISGNQISWPDAAGSNYNLMSKTNLLDASWSTNQTGLSGSPVVVPQTEQQEFFRVEVAP